LPAKHAEYAKGGEVRFRLRTLLIGVTAVCLFFGALAWLARELSKEHYVVERFSLGNDRELIILADSWWEMVQPYHYEIRENGQTIVKPTFITNGETWKPKFKIVWSSNGKVVGCRSIGRHGELECIHDFETGESWPAPSGKDAYSLERKEMLKARLDR